MVFFIFAIPVRVGLDGAGMIGQERVIAGVISSKSVPEQVC